MLCRNMDTSDVSIAREVISPVLYGEQVRVVSHRVDHGWNCFYFAPRRDRDFPDYRRVGMTPMAVLGDAWTLATESEVVLLRLLGKISEVECVETGE